MNLRLDLDAGIRALTRGQISLEFIALKRLTHLTDDGLNDIHSAFLKEIDFRWNEKIQDRGILNLVSNNLNLRVVHLVNCHSLTGQSLISLAQHLAEKLVSRPSDSDLHLIMLICVFLCAGNIRYRRLEVHRCTRFELSCRLLPQYTQVQTAWQSESMTSSAMNILLI